MSNRWCSLTAAAAQLAAVQQQQERQRAAAAAAAGGQPGGQQPWHLNPLCAGMTQPLGEPPMPAGWRTAGGPGDVSASSSSAGTPLQPYTLGSAQPQHLQQQQPAVKQELTHGGPAVPAAPAVADPWQTGLDLLFSGSAQADDSGLPLHLTDAALDALLAPFEDWAGQSAAPAPAPGAQHAQHVPTRQQLPPMAPRAVPAPQQHLQLQRPSPFAASPQGQPPVQPPQSFPSRQAVHPAGPAHGSAAAAAAVRGTSASPRTSSLGSDGGTVSGGSSDVTGKPRRKGGRPRVHHPRAPSSAGPAGRSLSPASDTFKKDRRGPKPKYVFPTKEEAVDARRERNRRAALESYYKKKERTSQLQAELSRLHSENTALEGLLCDMNTTGLCPLPEASQDGIDLWLQLNCNISGGDSNASTPAVPSGGHNQA